MKKLSFILWLIIPLVSIASSEKSFSDDSVKLSIRLNPIRLFESTFALNYEQRIANHWSLDVTAMGTYGSKDGLSDSYIRMAMASIDMDGYYYNTSMIMGWGIMVQPRYFLSLSKKAPVGAYTAPFAMFRRVSIVSKKWMTGNQYEECIHNLNIYAMGVVLGWKIPIKKVYCLDFYVGGAFRLSKYDSEKTFTKYNKWTKLDYSGVLPTIGVSIGILK
ncbi:MAG: DUF3575 domain-containing protein [Bacteroidota bacterium]